MKHDLKNGILSTVWAIAIALLLGGNFFIGRPEGKFFPVLSDFQAISVSKSSDGYLNYELSFEKTRDCDPINTRVFYIVGKYHIDLIVPHPPGWQPVNRPLGPQVVTMKISIPPAYYRSPITLVQAHKCFGPLLWTTRTSNTFAYDGPLLEANNGR